ncbi:hypothetical protein B0H16DRAFT_1895750 [Mycena metata]|uniref:Uncharacterized protein n=1 Tax=Mycena metata TaxID=1033252 RepID=A0AAD7MM16_9AGAR|nr:hypothetical protein B0H16DRAFT_1895750 [Mycena metata]
MVPDYTLAHFVVPLIFPHHKRHRSVIRAHHPCILKEKSADTPPNRFSPKPPAPLASRSGNTGPALVMRTEGEKGMEEVGVRVLDGHVLDPGREATEEQDEGTYHSDYADALKMSEPEFISREPTRPSVPVDLRMESGLRPTRILERKGREGSRQARIYISPPSANHAPLKHLSEHCALRGLAVQRCCTRKGDIEQRGEKARAQNFTVGAYDLLLLGSEDVLFDTLICLGRP